jgi:hypothetical protein
MRQSGRNRSGHRSPSPDRLLMPPFKISLFAPRYATRAASLDLPDAWSQTP